MMVYVPLPIFFSTLEDTLKSDKKGFCRVLIITGSKLMRVLVFFIGRKLSPLISLFEPALA